MSSHSSQRNKLYLTLQIPSLPQAIIFWTLDSSTLASLPFSIPTAPVLGQAPFTSHLEHLNSYLAGLPGSSYPTVLSILCALTWEISLSTGHLGSPLLKNPWWLPFSYKMKSKCPSGHSKRSVMRPLPNRVPSSSLLPYVCAQHSEKTQYSLVSMVMLTLDPLITTCIHCLDKYSLRQCFVPSPVLGKGGEVGGSWQMRSLLSCSWHEGKLLKTVNR